MAKKLISLIIDTPVELFGQNFISLNPHILMHLDVVSSEVDLAKENVISVCMWWQWFVGSFVWGWKTKKTNWWRKNLI